MPISYVKPRLPIVRVVVVLGFALLLALLPLFVSKAQSPDLSQTFVSEPRPNGSTLTFQYPADGFTKEGSKVGVLFDVAFATDPYKLYTGGYYGLLGDQYQGRVLVLDTEKSTADFGRDISFDTLEENFNLFGYPFERTVLKPKQDVTVNGKRAYTVAAEASSFGGEKVSSVDLVIEYDLTILVIVSVYANIDNLSRAETLAPAIAQTVQIGAGMPEPTPTSAVVADSVSIPNAEDLMPITADNAASLELVTTLPYTHLNDRALLVNREQNYFLLDPGAGRRYFMDGTSGKIVRELQLEKDPIAVSSYVKGISGDGAFFVVVGVGDRDTGVFDATTGKRLMHPEGIAVGEAAAISPDGQLVAFVGSIPDSGTFSKYQLALYNANDPQPIFTLPDVLVHYMDFSADGRYLVLASDGDGLRIIEVATQQVKLINTPIAKTQDGAIWFSPTQNIFATAGHDKAIHVWDAETATEKFSLSVPGLSYVSGAAYSARFNPQVFSPDGKMILTALTSDATIATTIVFWDAATGQKLAELPIEGSVNSLAMNPAGTFLAVASTDVKIQIYGIVDPEAETGRG